MRKLALRCLIGVAGFLAGVLGVCVGLTVYLIDVLDKAEYEDRISE